MSERLPSAEGASDALQGPPCMSERKGGLALLSRGVLRSVWRGRTHLAACGVRGALTGAPRLKPWPMYCRAMALHSVSVFINYATPVRL
jgi:hypothetical protein